MSGTSLFSPLQQGTVSITSAVTTANVALGSGTFDQLRVYNADAANISFINWGNSTVTASLPSGSTRGSLPIGPGQAFCFSIPRDTTHVAAICSAGTPIVYITLSGSGVVPVFPGDINGPWTGIFGLAPMTRAVYDASFIAPVACCEYERLSISGATGITGTINFINGALDIAEIKTACSLSSSPASQYIGTYQLRVKKWYNQSTVVGAPASLDQSDVNKAFTLGLIDNIPYLFAGPGDDPASYMECALPVGQRLSTAAGTSIVCCRPFNSKDSGALVYHGEFSSTQGVALRANGPGSTSLPTAWNYWNSFFDPGTSIIGVAGLVPTRRLSVSLMQRFAGAEFGLNTYSTVVPTLTSSLFTTNGFTIGSGGGAASFEGAIQGLLFDSSTREPAETLASRNAMNAAFGVAPISETINIVCSGFSMLYGAYASGVPAIAGATGQVGDFAKAWVQFFADALSTNYRVSSYGAAAGEADPWAEITARIPGIIAQYSTSASRNIYYCEFSSAPSGTAQDFIDNFTTYLNGASGFKAQALAAGQAWEIFVGGLTPFQATQAPSPTYTEVNTTLAANASSLGYVFNQPCPAATYAAGESLYTTANWIVSGHWTLVAHSIIGTAEGQNFNSIL